MGTLRWWVGGVGRGMIATVVVCAWPGVAGAQLRGASSAARGGSSSSSSERSGGSQRVEHHSSSSSSSSSSQSESSSPSRDEPRSLPEPSWGGGSPTQGSAWPPPRRATPPERDEARRAPPPRFGPRPVRGPRRTWTQLEGRQPWSRVPPRAPDRDQERRRLELERRTAVPPVQIEIRDSRPRDQAVPVDEEDEAEEDRRGMLRPENGGRLVLRRASRAVRSGLDPSCPPPRPVSYWGPRAPAGDEPAEERALSAQLHLDAGWIVPGAGRAELGARLLLPDGWNLEAAYSLYVEPTDDQGILVLALGRAGVSHRVAEDRAVSVRLGGALRHMQDWVGPAFGADVTLGVDMLLGDLVVLSAEGFAGVVGAAWLLQARASIGFLIDILELRIGYDHVVLEPIEGGPGGMLTGPFLGARLWL